MTTMHHTPPGRMPTPRRRRRTIAARLPPRRRAGEADATPATATTILGIRLTGLVAIFATLIVIAFDDDNIGAIMMNSDSSSNDNISNGKDYAIGSPLSAIGVVFVSAAAAPKPTAAAVAGVRWSGRGGGSGEGLPKKKKGGGEPSSTLLKMHRRLYHDQPPHDTSLYDALRVAPNATAADIARSYRKLSREYHPDKRRHRRRSKIRTEGVNLGDIFGDVDDDDDEADEEGGDGDGDSDSICSSEDDAEEMLEQVRRAYEVLKDDSTRLPYHRFGLLDTNAAAVLLTGGGGGGGIGTDAGDSSHLSREQRHLLRLMGYGPHYRGPGSHHQRVMLLAANLVETLRPLVEGTVSQEQLAHVVAAECDAVKTLPLGAQILRCIGRAYRHSGRRVLRKHHRSKKGGGVLNDRLRVGLDLTDQVHDAARNARQIFAAAAAGGRLVLTEQASKYRRKTREMMGTVVENALPSIGYHNDDAAVKAEEDLAIVDELFSDSDDGDTPQLPDQMDVRERERERACEAVIGALQIEALWKISKIELDGTIREACDIVLGGEYFFFPSHYHYGGGGRRRGEDGWVGSSGEVIEASVGRLRAAAAMVLVGDVLVRCSKEGTSWID